MAEIQEVGEMGEGVVEEEGKEGEGEVAAEGAVGVEEDGNLVTNIAFSKKIPIYIPEMMNTC